MARPPPPQEGKSHAAANLWKRENQPSSAHQPEPDRAACGPLGLEYLAAALEDQGTVVELLDLAWENDPLAAVRKRLLRGRYDAAGISVRNTDDCCYAIRDFLLPQIKELVGTVKLLTESPIVLGGCGFSIMPEAVLSHCGADYGLAGDGEAALPALLARLGKGASLVG